MSAWCKIKVRDAVVPVPGTSEGGTGQCPECGKEGVPLSVAPGRFIKAHTVPAVTAPVCAPQPVPVEGVAVHDVDYAELCDVFRIKVNAARSAHEGGVRYGKGLKEPMTDVADTGVRVGDPRAAEARRTAEIEGAYGTGTVKIPVTVPPKEGSRGKGRTRLEDVPATEANVRAALAYWKTRKPRTDAARTAQNDQVSFLLRRLRAMTEATAFRYSETAHTFNVVPSHAHLTAEPDACQDHRGPTLVRGRDTTPRVREAGLSWDEPTDVRKDGSVRLTTTFEQPLGRERFDRKITDVPEPEPVLSRSQKRNLRRKRCHAAYGARIAQGAASA